MHYFIAISCIPTWAGNNDSFFIFLFDFFPNSTEWENLLDYKTNINPLGSNL